MRHAQTTREQSRTYYKNLLLTPRGWFTKQATLNAANTH
jgi:hypothetical protein